MLVPVAYPVIFIQRREQHLALSSAQGLKDENTCGIPGAPEHVEKGQFVHLYLIFMLCFGHVTVGHSLFRGVLSC